MGMYTSSCGEEKHEDNQIDSFSGRSVCPVDELKSSCALRYATKEEFNWAGILMNGYICGHVQ